MDIGRPQMLLQQMIRAFGPNFETSSIVRHIAVRSPIEVFAATSLLGTSTAILVKSDSLARSFSDLKSKAIAAASGSVGLFLVVAARDKAGIKPSDVRIVFLSTADAGSAFSNGSVDAWST